MLTAIFIDGGYVDKCANSDVDYAKLIETLAGDSRILQTYYYNGYPYDVSEQKKPDPKHIAFYEKKTKFFRSLESMPKFTCRYGYTVFRNGDFMQKGVDSLLVVDMLTLAARKTVGSIKLLAGDRDFVAGVRAAREFGIIVDLFTFNEGTYAHMLRGECDSWNKLNANGSLSTKKTKPAPAPEPLEPKAETTEETPKPKTSRSRRKKTSGNGKNGADEKAKEPAT